jgi:O-antigen/teichoic acid export membrane protein
MKVEGAILFGVAIFFGIVAIIYWFVSHETAGTAMLTGASLLGLLPGSYYLWWSRRMKPRPEDDPTAEREDGAGIVNTFPSSSIWPFVLGVGCAAIGIALVFGAWSAAVGIVIAIVALLGFIRESRRGGVV